MIQLIRTEVPEDAYCINCRWWGDHLDENEYVEETKQRYAGDIKAECPVNNVHYFAVAGECRRFPPQVVCRLKKDQSVGDLDLYDKAGVFPVTFADQVCGEWSKSIAKPVVDVSNQSSVMDREGDYAITAKKCDQKTKALIVMISKKYDCKTLRDFCNLSRGILVKESKKSPTVINKIRKALKEVGARFSWDTEPKNTEG